MIQLTRLNNQPLAVNCDLIKFVEQTPDTVLTLINGEKLLVRETMKQVISRIVDFRRLIVAEVACLGSVSLGACPTRQAGTPDRESGELPDQESERG